MTVVSFCSLKGAPGITTLACLVGATWPAPRRAMVVECDSSGGDLGVRFQLSAKAGWTSFVASARRTQSGVAIEPHLQKLPGGLDVLTGSVGADGPDAVKSIAALLASAESSPEGQWDVLIDLGRVIAGDGRASACLSQSDAIVLGVRSDAASVMHVRESAPRLFARYAGRVGLAVIQSGCYSNAEIEEFTGIPAVGEVPSDPHGAAVATGATPDRRRLRRSLLVPSAARLATRLVQPTVAGDGRATTAEDLADPGNRLSEGRTGDAAPDQGGPPRSEDQGAPSRSKNEMVSSSRAERVLK